MQIANQSTYHRNIEIQLGRRTTSNGAEAGGTCRCEAESDDGDDQTNSTHKPQPWVGSITFAVSKKTTSCHCVSRAQIDDLGWMKMPDKMSWEDEDESCGGGDGRPLCIPGLEPANEQG